MGIKSADGTERIYDKSANSVSVIGVPYAGGQPKGGVDNGPRILREGGIINQITELGWKVEDKGDIKIEPVDPNDAYEHLRNPRNVGETNRRVYEAVSDAALHDNFVLTIGGDHSIAVGTVAGILRARPDACIIWVDAHADINTTETSPSGNMHGMPISTLMGLGSMRQVPGFEWIKDLPKLASDRIAYIGLRDLDNGEKQLIRDLNITALGMNSVDHLGIRAVVEKALDAVNPNRDRPIHLSFDIDGIDASLVPSTGTPVPGGLNLREARYICEQLEETGLLGSVDLVEFNPELGNEQDMKNTLATSMLLTKAIFGHKLV